MSSESYRPGQPRNGESLGLAERLPVSVCIVAHNEADNIERAILSAQGWAEEIVVVDCESTDGTGELALRLGANVYQRPNIIPEANKNASFDCATCEWIFSLDADELIPKELWQEIATLIHRAPAENGFKIPRRNFYFGQPLRYGGAFPDRQLRLFRKGLGRYPGKGYHERINVQGATGELQTPFDHHPYPTFEIWLRKFDFYTKYAASVLEQRNVPITSGSIRHHMITRPLRRWFERLFLKRGIKDGVPGVLAASFDLMTNIVGFGRYWMLLHAREKERQSEKER